MSEFLFKHLMNYTTAFYFSYRINFQILDETAQTLCFY